VAAGVNAEGPQARPGPAREGQRERRGGGPLLEDLVERGAKPRRRRLFVTDGAKALLTAIDRVYGRHSPVQRCRQHKLRNVLGHLPKDQHDRATATLPAAWKLDAKLGMQKIEQYAAWLERD
jgi:transposase-like protein